INSRARPADKEANPLSTEIFAVISAVTGISLAFAIASETLSRYASACSRTDSHSLLTNTADSLPSQYSLGVITCTRCRGAFQRRARCTAWGKAFSAADSPSKATTIAFCAPRLPSLLARRSLRLLKGGLYNMTNTSDEKLDNENGLRSPRYRFGQSSK